MLRLPASGSSCSRRSHRASIASPSSSIRVRRLKATWAPLKPRHWRSACRRSGPPPARPGISGAQHRCSCSAACHYRVVDEASVVVAGANSPGQAADSEARLCYLATSLRPNLIFGAASAEGSWFSTLIVLSIVTRSMRLLVRRRRHELLDGIRERNAHVIADTHGGHGWDNFARNASTSFRSALNRDPITTASREAFSNM
jgi:hypothetical protein